MEYSLCAYYGLLEQIGIFFEHLPLPDSMSGLRELPTIHVQRGYIARYGLLPLEVIGIFGNILALLTFIKGDFSAPTYNYFRCLAVSDLLMLLNDVTRTLRWGWRDFFCGMFSTQSQMAMERVNEYLDALFICTSCMLLTCITADRYVAVYKPLKFKIWSTKTRTKILSAACFLVSCLCVAIGLTIRFTTSDGAFDDAPIFIDKFSDLLTDANFTGLLTDANFIDVVNDLFTDANFTNILALVIDALTDIYTDTSLTDLTTLTDVSNNNTSLTDLFNTRTGVLTDTILTDLLTTLTDLLLTNTTFTDLLTTLTEGLFINSTLTNSSLTDVFINSSLTDVFTNSTLTDVSTNTTHTHTDLISALTGLLTSSTITDLVLPDALLYTILPFVVFLSINHCIIIVLTVLSIVGFRKLKRDRAQLGLTPRPAAAVEGQEGQQDQQAPNFMKDIRRLMTLMVWVTVVYVIFTTPTLIIMFLLLRVRINDASHLLIAHKLGLAEKFLQVCTSTYNFFVYVVGLRHFRNQFTGLCQKLH